MCTMNKATLYLRPELHKALKLKAVESNLSISEVANRAIEVALAEDLEDIRLLRERAGGPTDSYEQVLAALKADGTL